MDEAEREKLPLDRAVRYLVKLKIPSYRTASIGAHIRYFLAQQMKAMRGGKTQAEMAKLLGTTQSIISKRYENPSYDGWKISTLIEIAAQLNRALVIRFVDLETFTKAVFNVGDEAQSPPEINEDSINALIAAIESEESVTTALATIEAQNARIAELEGALTFYADKANWREPEQVNKEELFDTAMSDDLGDRARAILSKKPVHD